MVPVLRPDAARITGRIPGRAGPAERQCLQAHRSQATTWATKPSAWCRPKPNAADARFHDLGSDHYDSRYHPRQQHNLIRQLERITGQKVVLATA
jgi:hypothetical protein